MKKASEIKELFSRQEALTRWLGYLLVVGMLVCMGISAAMLVGRFVPGWSGGYLPWLVGLVSIEALVAQQRQRRMQDMDISLTTYFVVEWIVILVLVKLSMYLYLGVERLQADLGLWEDDFFTNFFSIEFILVVMMALAAWGLARAYGADLKELEGDVELLVQREETLASNRSEARQRIQARVLVVGGGMIFFTAMANVDLRNTFVDWSMGPRLGGGNIVVYFIFGLLLLSLARFATLRAIWAWERIPLDMQIGQRWVLNSLLMLAGVGILALLMPTDYTIGLLDTLRFVFSWFTTIVYGLLLLLLYPLIALFSLLMSWLFGSDKPVESAPIVMPTPPAIPAETANQAMPAWVAILQSMLFWVILLGIIGYAFVQYLHSNRALVESLRKVRGWRLILRAFQWVREQFGGLRKAVGTLIEANGQRLMALVRGRRNGDAWNYINLRNLNPRQRVLFYYLAMLRRGAESGIARQPDQTPKEYADALEEQIPEEKNDVEAVTASFLEARYSAHVVSAEQVSAVRQQWERLRQALRRRK